jgi:BirA family biotin operon repressor/biotin-[acetyl-CoA-carboxylase] ligase
VARFEIFDSLPSTQTVALQRLRSGDGEAGWILAREQTKGVGQHGRSWVGQKGNFMASRYEVMEIDVRSAPQLSFITALAVYEMLRPLVPDTDAAMRIKWPNDILHKGRKLCGILVQTEALDLPGKLGVIIGVGLNIRMAPVLEGYPTVALREISPEGGKLDAEALLYKVNGHLDGVIDLWRRRSFADIADAWFKRAYGVDRQVSVRCEGREVRGRITGLDSFGALKVTGEDGQAYAITGGEVSYGERCVTGD